MLAQPVVVLLEQDRADQTEDRLLVGEYPDNVGAALYLLVQPFQWVDAVKLGAVLSGEGHLGKRISVYTVDQYPAAGELARRMAVQFQVQVKLLTMTAAELHAFLNVNPGDLFSDPEGDATMRALVVKTCKETPVSSNDQSARADAFNLLVQFGEVSP